MVHSAHAEEVEEESGKEGGREKAGEAEESEPGQEDGFAREAGAHQDSGRRESSGNSPGDRRGAGSRNHTDGQQRSIKVAAGAATQNRLIFTLSFTEERNGEKDEAHAGG